MASANASKAGSGDSGAVMHDIISSIILGIVEGLTEFLPVSSTGHLLVAERLLGLGDEWEAFTIVIQLGAILAVVAIYFRKFWDVLVTLPSSAEARRFTLGILIAFLPAAVMGVIFGKILNNVLLNPRLRCPLSPRPGSSAASSF